MSNEAALAPLPVTSRKTAPGPEGRVSIREIWRFRTNPLEAVFSLHAEYGDMVYIASRLLNATFVGDPELIKQVLVTDHRFFEKSFGLKRTKLLLGDGLLTSEHDIHRRQRKLIQPIFHRDPMRGYAGPMVECASQARDKWEDGAEIDMAQEMMRLTLSIVGRTLFNTDTDKEAEDIAEALTTVVELFPLALLPFATYLINSPLPQARRARAARARLNETVFRMIDERLASGAQGGDLLSLLLSAHDEQGGMSREMARDEAMTLFLAGHETTAVGLAWTWYLLALHPEVRTKLYAELDAVLGGRTPCYDDVPNLIYTNRVVKESMRLYPPAFIFGRQAMVDYQLGPYLLPKGSMVFFSPYWMQRNPKYYDDPEQFDPGRWTPKSEEALPKFAYFPFGGGPRVCIGQGFAMIESVLVLATLAQRWHASLLPGQKIVPQTLITLRPSPGIKMRLMARAAAPVASPPPAGPRAAVCPHLAS